VASGLAGSSLTSSSGGELVELVFTGDVRIAKLVERF